MILYLNATCFVNENIRCPIILAEISSGRYNVIDGNHRLEKAYRMEIGYITACKLKRSAGLILC
ncbi:MAG: ParB N-terminal domain-containing protein [Smithella sp.]